MQRVPVMKMVNHIEYIRRCKHKEFSLWMIRVKQTRGEPIEEGIRRQQSIGAGLLCSNFFCIELSSLFSIIMIGPFSFPISHLGKDFRVWIGYYSSKLYFHLHLAVLTINLFLWYLIFILILYLINPYPFPQYQGQYLPVKYLVSDGEGRKMRGGRTVIL